MEVVIPGRGTDLDMLSMTAPSSPRQLSGCFFSAPTSPRRMARFYTEFDEAMSRPLVIPFAWEEKPGTPKSPPKGLIPCEDHDEDVDFAFDVGDKSETASLFAEELFDGGKIKPLKPPPRLQLGEFEKFKKTSPVSSPRSPRSPVSHGKEFLRKAFSPRKKSADADPFETAIENTRKKAGDERGRERVQDSKRKTSRSLSPFRVSAYPWEEQEQEQEQEKEGRNKQLASSCDSKGSFSSMSSKSSSRKWSLRSFLLFRSASEGRANHKYSVKKFSSFFKKHEDVKNSSFRSTDSSDSPSSSRRRGSSMSAHEFHYVVKKAESQERKRKTFLPYKQGILGRFAF